MYHKVLLYCFFKRSNACKMALYFSDPAQVYRTGIRISAGAKYSNVSAAKLTQSTDNRKSSWLFFFLSL